MHLVVSDRLRRRAAGGPAHADERAGRVCGGRRVQLRGNGLELVSLHIRLCLVYFDGRRWRWRVLLIVPIRVRVLVPIRERLALVPDPPVDAGARDGRARRALHAGRPARHRRLRLPAAAAGGRRGGGRAKGTGT